MAHVFQYLHTRTNRVQLIILRLYYQLPHQYHIVAITSRNCMFTMKTNEQDYFLSLIMSVVHQYK